MNSRVYHEMGLTIIPNKDVSINLCNEWLSQVISKAMTFNEALRIKHKMNTFKFYVYDLPRPLEPEKVYRSDRAYALRIRSFDLEFLFGIKSALINEDCGLKVISAHIVPKTYKQITEIKTLTPIVCTLNRKYWINDDGILILRDKMFSNACRKAKLIFKDFEEPEDNFIDGITQLNKVPIAMKYKGATLLGAKVQMLIKEDKNSQILAYTIMGSGALEKNSLGCGFCISK